MINDVLLKAISWTLVHSLWQGFILALLAGLVIMLTQKSNAALRYNLFAGLFIVFLGVVGFTFSYEFQNDLTETTTRINLPLQNIQNNLLFNPQSNFSQTVVDYLNTHAEVVVMIWFLIFSFKFFGIFRSLSHVYRIRNYKTQSPPEFWVNKLNELSERIGLTKKIILLESRLVKVPSVTGFFKPVVLIPAGLLSNLPYDQIEAILLHELAHIRRKDYCINMIQSFAEIVFFFNPGLLWLSSLLKDERENCCDDIAISITENKSKFIHALVSFEEYNLKNQQLVMGFGANKNHLLNRAKRIVYNNNKSLNAIEKTFLSVSVLLIAVVMIACSNTKITETSQQSESNLKKADVLVKIADANAKAEDIRVAIMDKQVRIQDSLTLIEDRKATIADAQAAIDDSKLYYQNKKVAEENQKHYKKAQLQSATTATSVSNTKTETETEIVNTTTQNPAENGKRISIRTGVTGEDLPANMNTDALARNIISDLISENIISNTKDLSYKLSNKSLIVNGKTQPESDFQKFRNKYVKAKIFAICYNYEVSDIVSIKN